jgi:hypothetical protein
MTGFSVRQVVPLVGLVIGLVLGLVYQWGISPVELINTNPALLRFDYRHDWVRMVALSYVADGDLDRVRARLEGLEHEDIEGPIGALIEEYAAAGYSADTLRRLSVVADTFDVRTSAMLVYLSTPGALPTIPTRTPSPTSSFTPTVPVLSTFTPVPVPTPIYVSSPLQTPTPELTGTLPTPGPTVTPSLLYRLTLAEQEQICRPGQVPRVEVVVKDDRGTGVPGVEIWLMWPGGADRAVTGLKPQDGAGYADFNVEPNVRYSLGIGEVGMPLVTDLRLDPCPTGEDTELMGSWRIVLEPRSAETD